MTFTFLTNYLTHHQLPFCREMAAIEDVDMQLIVTDRMDEERVRMGWGLDAGALPGCRYMEDDVEGCETLIRESDVVLCGGADDYFLRDRLKEKKPTLRYYERIFKDGYLHALGPRGIIKNYDRHTKHRSDPVYLLCAGAYVAHDFDLLLAYPDKKYKWGYFPQFIEYSREELKRKEHGSVRILWTGRMIDWKHPEHVIYVAEKLKERGLDFSVKMIGEGDMAAEVDRAIKEKELAGFVERHPFMKPEEIREEMLSADIYLCTSDHKEGWGAVVNEAMNAGCAVVASSGAGAVPFLIKHEVNGMVYPSGERGILTEAVAALAEDRTLRERLGLEAYSTIAGEWNAGAAAERLAAFCRALLQGKEYRQESGPLSKAPDIRPGRGWLSCI